MSEKDRMDTDSGNKTSLEKKSRRSFITGAAAVAVGAVANGAISADKCEFPELQQGASSPCNFKGIVMGPNGFAQVCPPATDDQLKKYVPVILEAWNNADYRKRLLTFDEGRSLDWRWYTTQQRKDMLKKTQDALYEQGVTVTGNPVVLSELQLDRGVFWKLTKDEEVLRLPNPRITELTTLKLAAKSVSTEDIHEFVLRFIRPDSGNICGM